MAFKVERDFVSSGLRCVVLGLDMGHRCGYVGVPRGHPLHGVGYHEQAACLSQDMADQATVGKKSPITVITSTCSSDGDGIIRRSPDVVFDVHGGLTYSGSSDEYPVPSDLWWFGFDCAHYNDAKDPTLMSERYLDIERYYGANEGEIRSEAYVVSECESLAKQLTQLQPPQVGGEPQ